MTILVASTRALRSAISRTCRIPRNQSISMQSGRIGSLASWNINNSNILPSQQAAFSTGAGNSERTGVLLSAPLTSGTTLSLPVLYVVRHREAGAGGFDQDQRNCRVLVSRSERKRPLPASNIPAAQRGFQAGPSLMCSQDTSWIKTQKGLEKDQISGLKSTRLRKIRMRELGVVVQLGKTFVWTKMCRICWT